MQYQTEGERDQMYRHEGLAIGYDLRCAVNNVEAAHYR